MKEDRTRTSGVDLETALKALRKAHVGEEAMKVYDAFRSHAAISRKNRLILALLDDLRQADEEVSKAKNLALVVLGAI